MTAPAPAPDPTLNQLDLIVPDVSAAATSLAAIRFSRLVASGTVRAGTA